MHSLKAMIEQYKLSAYSCLLTLYRFLRARLYFPAAIKYALQPYPSLWDTLASSHVYNQVKGSVFQALDNRTTFPRSIWRYLTLFRVHYTVLQIEYPSIDSLVKFYRAGITMFVINPYYLVVFGKQLGAKAVDDYARILGLPTHSTLLRCITMQTLVPQWSILEALLKAGAVFGSLFVTGIENAVFVERIKHYQEAMRGQVLDFSVVERNRIFPFVLAFFEGAMDETTSVFGSTCT